MGLLLKRRSGLSTRNGVLLFKQLIRPTKDYAGPIWRSAVRPPPRSGNWRCFNPSVFASLTMHLCTVVTRKRYEDMGAPFFADHIRSLRYSTQKLADVGKRLVTQLGRYLLWPSVDPGPIKQGDRNRQLVLATRKRRPCQHIDSCPTGTFRLPCLRVFRAF
jgi:hypothetical protein